MGKLICLVSVYFLALINTKAQNIYEVTKALVHFSSTAPLELISADSKELKGALDISKKSFAFKMPIISFKGFNSPLQREHFNENYMESELYPDASFAGKIIEDVSLDKPGDYKIRAKGKLRIHNVEQERIISVFITSNGNKLIFRSDFTVSLSDHNIKIPRVVYDKLAPDIQVQVNGVLQAIK